MWMASRGAEARRDALLNSYFRTSQVTLAAWLAVTAGRSNLRTILRACFDPCPCIAHRCTRAQRICRAYAIPHLADLGIPAKQFLSVDRFAAISAPHSTAHACPPADCS